MARRCTAVGSGDRSAACAAQENTEAAVRVEEMAMCRHIGSAGRCGDVEWKLCRIVRLLEEQNGMMAELLRRVCEQE